MTRTRKTVIVILAIVTVIAVARQAHATSPTGTERGVVLFVGDSNITLGSQAIDWAATWTGTHHDRPYIPVMASTVGASLRDDPAGDFWKVRLGAILGRVQPDAIVIDLGINDTNLVGTPTTRGYAAYAGKIDWLMGHLPQVPVFWTNLPCRIEPAARARGCAAVNTALKGAPSRWPLLTVLDWAGKANGHPGWMPKTGAGVHLNGTGQSAWATLVVTALDHRLQ